MQHDHGYFEESKLGKTYDVKLLKRLSPFTRPYRLMLFGSIALVLLITCLDLALPYVTKIAIDRHIVPMITASAAGKDIDTESRKRVIRVDLSDSRQRALVEANKELFIIDDDSAQISYSQLPGMKKSDLSVLRKHDIKGLTAISVVFIVLVITNFLLSFGQKMIMEYTGLMIMHDLRMKLFGHIQNLSLAYFTRNPVGRLVTRTTNDIQNMHELFTSVISMFFKDLSLLFGIAVVMLVINWKLALVSFIVLPAVLYASINFSKRARDIFRELRVKV
ncbi:MAG: ABC transporter ATP-binding protein, partial [Desulfobacterales bacterium]